MSPFRLGSLVEITLLLLLTLAVASSPATSVAQPSDQQAEDPRARKLFEAGREAYDRGRFTEALALYEQAYTLSPRSKMLFNIGRAAEADGDDARAVQAYTEYLEANPAADNREFVEARLARLASPRNPAAGQGRQPVRAAPGSSSQRARTTPAPRAVSGPAPGDATYPPPVYAAPPTASEGVRWRRFRLYTGLRFGAAASESVENDEDLTIDLDTAGSISLQLGAAWVWKIVGIGAEFRHTWVFSSERLTELLIKPRAGYQFQRLPLELYGAIPVGLAIHSESLWSVGASYAFLLGASWFFGDRFGLNLETGLQLASFRGQDLGEGFSLQRTEWTVLSANFVVAL